MRWERPWVRLQEFWLGMSRCGLALELPLGWCSARRSIARKNAAPSVRLSIRSTKDEAVAGIEK